MKREDRVGDKVALKNHLAPLRGVITVVFGGTLRIETEAGELDGELPSARAMSRLDRVRTLPLAEALDLTRQIALGMSAAHAEQIVHRDLKPDNVFLLPAIAGNPEERVKILDFGIAKLVLPSGTGSKGANVVAEEAKRFAQSFALTQERAQLEEVGRAALGAAAARNEAAQKPFEEAIEGSSSTRKYSPASSIRCCASPGARHWRRFPDSATSSARPARFRPQVLASVSMSTT